MARLGRYGHMSEYTIVNADDVEDHYAGTDVPGEFRRLTPGRWRPSRSG